MTPAGRPPRSTSSSIKTISVRVTADEYKQIKKAADSHHVSVWLRDVALAKIAEPAPLPIPSGAMRELADRMMAPLQAIVMDQDKRDALRAMSDELAVRLESLVQIAQKAEAHGKAMEESNADMWRLLYKFAAHIKHDEGCAKYPCACSIKAIAVEVGTALALGKAESSRR